MTRCLIRVACLFVVAAWPSRPALAQKPPAGKPAQARPLKRFDRIMENVLREHRIAGETTDREYGGNWVASAPDLVRFLMALDGSRGKPFLRRKTMAQMLAPPPPPAMGGAHKCIPEAIRQVKMWPARDLFEREAK